MGCDRRAFLAFTVAVARYTKQIYSEGSRDTDPGGEVSVRARVFCTH